MLFGFGGRAEAYCHVTNWRFAWDSEAAAYMETDGARCSTSVKWTRGTSEIHSVSISAAPRNGTLSAAGRGVTYRPRQGFKGEDAFAFTVHGRRAGTPPSAVVRVNVIVR